MQQKRLTDIAYNYFPLNNTQVHSDEYYATKEMKRLEAACKAARVNTDKWILCCKEIEQALSSFRLHDVSFKYEGRHSRCYALVIYFYNDENKEIILDVDASFIAPFYTIAVLEFKKLETFKWDHPPKVTFDFNTYDLGKKVSVIKTIIEMHFQNQEFPERELVTVIPGISFENIPEGSFTYFNAFFCNEYRIRF